MQDSFLNTLQQQHPNSPHPRKGTPGRRRHNRNTSQPHGRKTYASENDMPSDAPPPMAFIQGGPFTPQKSPSNSPAPLSQQNNSKTKPRTGVKPRPKNVDTSPGPSKPGRKTPPYTAGAKPSSTAAFAGATFHASPAPSSLPLPSFLASKALDSPGVKEEERVIEPSPPPTDSETPTPQHNAHLTKPEAQDSPLDLFFKADRAEKERARRASSANALSTLPGPFSPPLQGLRPQEAKTIPQMVGSQPSRRAPLQRNSSGISAMELDGTPGRPMGPAFSTPYQERIRAARSGEKQGGPFHDIRQQSPLQQQQTPPLDRSQQLMSFLGIKQSPDSRANNITHGPVHSPTPPARPIAGSNPSQGYPHTGQQQYPPTVQQYSPPVQQLTSNEATGIRPADVLQMENNLRKMLKINGLNLGAAPTPTSYQSS